MQDFDRHCYIQITKLINSLCILSFICYNYVKLYRYLYLAAMPERIVLFFLFASRVSHVGIKIQSLSGFDINGRR